MTAITIQPENPVFLVSYRAIADDWQSSDKKIDAAQIRRVLHKPHHA